MEVLSLQIYATSTRYGKMVQSNQKGRSKEKICGQKTMITCQAANTMQNGRTSNFNELLSLDYSKFVGLDEIKRTYRCKALKFHPDACPDPSTKEESMRRFIELRIAYETLSDPILREMYDQELNLVDLQGRTSHGMNCSIGKRRGGGVEGFPREVWERQIIELKKRSMQKWRREIKWESKVNYHQFSSASKF